MKRLILLVFFARVLTPLYGADAKLGADTLGRWVGGKWSGEGAMVNSDFSKGMTLSGVTTCVWSPDHIFVVCDQAVKANDKPGRQLSLYGYDPDTSKFHFFGLSPSEAKARTPELVISSDGNRWEYLNTEDIKGKSVRFRTVNIFHDADHVEWWADYSTDDGQHWTKMGGGEESRQH
jgi:hypothetical protein